MQRNLGAMKARDRSDEAEAEAVARCVAALFEPVEAIEDVIALRSGNARTVVGDRDVSAAIGAAAGHRDLAALAAVLDRIVDEIGDGVEQQVAVAGDCDLTIA